MRSIPGGRTSRWVLPLVLIQAAALGTALGLWWGERHNTLFHNPRWVVGKDTGKFVFYTFEYLFRPLAAGAADLSRDMAFQEILHREPEGPRRRLESLAFTCRISPGGYLFVTTGKSGARALSARISRSREHPSGFHRYGPRGDLEDFSPFAEDPPWSSGGSGERVELRRDGDEWALWMNGRLLGTAASLPAGGSFGFRGSGNPGAPVTVGPVAMLFRDTETGSTWTEREDFSSRAGARRALPAALGFALAALLLRRWRRGLAGALLQPPERSRLVAADEIGISAAALLAAGTALLRPAAGLAVPAALLAAEFVYLAALALAFRAAPPAPDPRGARALLPFGLAVGLIAAAALARHGDLLGRDRQSTWWKMRSVHADAYLPRPGATRSSPPFAAAAPFPVAQGAPFFPAGAAYRQQRISVDFVPHPTATFDVVFQQQSFTTRGDPRGEELPLQRRLLRLTTRSDVPAGLATGTHKALAPFVRVAGSVRPAAPNRLAIRSEDRGVELTLNGERTFVPGAKPLGYGETGLLAYDAPVTVTAFRVEALPGARRGERLLPLLGLLSPLAAALIPWALLRLAGPVPLGAAAQLLLGGLWPIATYLGGAALLDGPTLLLLTRERLAWLDLGLAAAAGSLPVLVIAVRGMVRGAVGFFYAGCGAVAAALLVFGFDRILLTRPELLQRLGVETEATVPGEMVRSNVGSGPWYSQDRLVGASNYVWRQRFGTKEAPSAKPPGTARIFLMGGSQAWGSGAADSFSTFDQLLERRLKARGQPVEVYNAGVNGAGVSRVRGLYLGLVAEQEPDILLLDIGLNDSAGFSSVPRAKRAERREALLRELGTILDRCRAGGVDVLLILEPICGETPLRPDAGLYEGYERLARERGARVLSPKAALRDAERHHPVWWDTAHLAPFGHELMSRLLEPLVAEMVRERANRAPH